MSVPLTSLAFHTSFVLPPAVLRGWLAASRDDGWWGRPPLSGMTISVVQTIVLLWLLERRHEPRFPCLERLRIRTTPGREGRPDGR